MERKKKSAKKPELAQSAEIEELPLACSSEAAAVDFFERKRWPISPCCPCCGDVDVYQMKDRHTGERNKDYRWRCRGCSKLYTVRTGMIFEESLIPLHKWARAMWEAASAKNGISALEMSRKVQVSYKSALFMMHRIRYAMAQDHSPEPKLTGTVEADETYVGGKPRYPAKKKGKNPLYPKTPVFAVVQRGGDVRASIMATVTGENVKAALLARVDRSADLLTDDLNVYRGVGSPFNSHRTVNHSAREYVNAADPTSHTNTIEGFFSRVKRQLNGTYHAVSREHLHRYVAHAEFLYNARGMNDGERVVHLIRSADGKRLVYRQPA